MRSLLLRCAKQYRFPASDLGVQFADILAGPTGEISPLPHWEKCTQNSAAAAWQDNGPRSEYQSLRSVRRRHSS